jgi:anti-repressor protein
MTIDYAQQEKLQRTGRIKIVEALGGKDAPAYKRLNKKAFSLFWNDYKRYMGVNSYKNTAVKDLVKANDFIDKWKPTEELELMIVGANAQMRM